MHFLFLFLMHFPKAKATAVFYPTEKSLLWCACVHADLLSHQSITVFFSVYLRDEVTAQGVEELILVKCYGTSRISILRGISRITLLFYFYYFEKQTKTFSVCRQTRTSRYW